MAMRAHLTTASQCRLVRLSTVSFLVSSSRPRIASSRSAFRKEGMSVGWTWRENRLVL